ncbi:MAG: hypothetical protein K2N46_11830 [Lachnospiraceae bacterium]|nr:hypothetical protein [Lachnospiraceae bacterium]
MQQLIKITSVPMRTMSYTQNARLVSSDSVDMERRKALARQMSFHRNAGKAGCLPMQDIAKINRTFSKRTVTAPQGQNISRYQAAFHQAQAMSQSVPTAESYSMESTINNPVTDSDYVYISSAMAASVPMTNGSISMEASSSYVAERGSLEMRVAKGELAFLPPMVMTIVTQYPELHFEYLGDFNYVPPRDPQTGGNINLTT